MHDINIFMITETKLDASFRLSQFNIEGFSILFRLDQNKNDRTIVLYIRSYIIASKLTSFTLANDIETYIEINLKDNNWLICCLNNPIRIFVPHHLVHKGINTYWKKYQKKLLMEDFNVALWKLI